MLGVLLRAIYDHITVIVQLLLRGGSTQGLGFLAARFQSIVKAASRLLGLWSEDILQVTEQPCSGATVGGLCELQAYA